jgi:Zn-dependent protease with chaperone function
MDSNRLFPLHRRSPRARTILPSVALLVAVTGCSSSSSRTEEASPVSAQTEQVSVDSMATTEPTNDVRFQNSTVIFTSAEETAALMTANDPYKVQLSATDRQLLAASAEPVDVEKLDSMLREAAEDFTDDQRQQISRSLSMADQRMQEKSISFPLPSNVRIAIHNSAIFSGSPYTRADTIFVNDQFLGSVDAEMLASVLAHEMWHISSRNNPEARADIYKLVGFAPCQVPLGSIGADLRDRIMTNPDTEEFGSFCIQLPDDGAGDTKTYTSLVIAAAPFTGNNFGDILKPVLVEVTADGTSAATTADGKTVIRDLDADYIEAIGGNGQDQPFHPEEVVAINLQVALRGEPTEGSPNLALAEKVAAAPAG